ncbi:MAG TPA: YfjI family protein [Polyangiaceae bacterium]|nr:YfjI family protein [Polyangiaceae bacterium]
MLQNGLPEFPTNSLPSWFRRFVENVAVAKQVPTALPAMIGLATLGATVATKAKVVVRPGYEEVLCVWTACVLGPGERKTSVVRDATRPLELVEAALSDVWHSVAAEEGDPPTSFLARFERADWALGPAPEGAERPGFREVVRAIASQYDQIAPGVVPELLVDNVTSASLVEILHRQAGRIAVLNGEGAFFDNLTRYSRNGSADIDEFLRGHVAEAIRRHRKGQGAIIIRAPHITVGIAPQPEVLRGLRRTPALRGRGLTSRFLWAVPASMLGNRAVAPPGLDPSVLGAYEEHVWAMMRLGWVEPLRPGILRPYELALTEGALTVRDSFAEEVEARLAIDGDLRVVADWASKLPGMVVRLAGIVHLAEHAPEGARAFQQPISESTMAAAVRIGSFAIPHALAAHELLAGSTLEDDAAYVVSAIRKAGWTEFSLNQVHRRVDGRLRRSEQVGHVLEHLVEQRIIRLIAARTLTGGRPLGPVYGWSQSEEE